VIEEDEIGFGRASGRVDLVELASADERCGIRAGTVLHEYGGDLGFGRARELLELGERKIKLEVAGKRGLWNHDGGIFAACGAVKRGGGTGLPRRRRKTRTTAGEIDSDENSAFTRCTTAASPCGNGLGAC